jgi:ribosomal protein S18 acetylase RimI-like enzyme
MLELRPLGVEDIDAYLAHHEKHRLESGRDGDPHFTPFSEPGELAGARQSRLEGWPRPVSETSWIRTWGLFDGDRMIGDVELQGGDIEATRHRAFVGIGIQRDYREQGWGRRMMVEAIDWARSAGVAWIDLGVFAGNPVALKLYRDLGFVEKATFEDAFRIEGSSIADIRMVLDLRA